MLLQPPLGQEGCAKRSATLLAVHNLGQQIRFRLRTESLDPATQIDDVTRFRLTQEKVFYEALNLPKTL